MHVAPEELIINGKARLTDVLHVAGKELVVSGKYVKTARLKEEWDVDVEDPQTVVHELKESGVDADIFTFMQRLPYSKPRFDYPMEWDSVAAIPITDYNTWFKKQLHENPRNKIRKAQKAGVVAKIVDFNNDLIEGIRDIYNETPVRQGRPYWNYGMDSELVRKENSQFLERATFVGAYYRDELIGFIRIVRTDRFARTMGIIGKIAHRDKAPMNVLIAKAVEICAENKIPFLVYAKFNYGKLGSDTLQDFKYYNAFESVVLPRYHLPLTAKGRAVLSLGLQHGVIEVAPKAVVRLLRELKRSWHARMNHTNSIEK